MIKSTVIMLLMLLWCCCTLRFVCSKGPQIKALGLGVDVVVATPGRCNDLIEMGYLDLSKIDYFVLDEADRM